MLAYMCLSQRFVVCSGCSGGIGVFGYCVEVEKEYFFFSSRRRHTRLQGDWSSDVCSSDLGRSLRGWDLIALTKDLYPTKGQFLSQLIAFCLREIGRASCRERV